MLHIRLRRFARVAAPVCALLLAMFCSATPASARPGDRSSEGVWTELDQSVMPNAVQQIGIEPQSLFRVYMLDENNLTTALSVAPLESKKAGAAGALLTLPLGERGYVRFRVYESPILSARVAATMPRVHTYIGQGVDDATLSVRFDRTTLGFHALVHATDDLFIVEPAGDPASGRYVTYRRSELAFEPASVFCKVSESEGGLEVAPERLLAPPSGATLSQYDLAIGVTGEFTQFFGSMDNARNRLVTIVNQLNAIYEPEVSIRFRLACTAVPPDTLNDRYTLPDNITGGLLDQNNSALNDSCGVGGYDIGHLLHANNSGGLAGVGVVCGGSKGRGASSWNPPTNANLVADIMAHEVGHQFSARHSFNTSIDPPGTFCGAQRIASSAYEIGGGSTIMAYNPGRCGIEGINEPNDFYFHTHSFDQITDFRDGGAAGCRVTSATGNTAPSVNAGSDYTIPRGTPFVLTATGSDAENDPLTFCWEQMDLGSASPPLNGGATGPLFRSRPPVTSPVRTFPRLFDLVNNSVSPFEILPTADRDINFRCTARDNRMGGGGVNYDGMVLHVAGDPFFVTAPNGGETLHQGCDLTVQWTVGGGNVAANVAIALSTDGGLTFPTVLVASTANDGEATVAIPCVTTTRGRIRIAAIDNVFFDVSNNDFSIISVAPTVTAEATGGEVGSTCTFTVPFSGKITDDCAVDPTLVAVSASSVDGNSTVGTPVFNTVVVGPAEVTVSGTVEVSALTACPAMVRIGISGTDNCGVSNSQDVDVEVVDTTPPSIAVTLDRLFLWPPNHKLVDIKATVVVTDNCPGVSYVLSAATSNEPEDGLGDGDTAPDIEEAALGTADTHVLLRAERSGTGTGRVYTLTYTASDQCGNSASASAQVRVAHDQSGHAVVAFGFSPDGSTIDPRAQAVALVVPSLTTADVPMGDIGAMVIEAGAEPSGGGTVSDVVFDAPYLVPASAQLGNTAGVATALRVETLDATGDGLADRLLVFDARNVRALLAKVVEDGPVGLHYATKQGEAFLVPNILAIDASQSIATAARSRIDAVVQEAAATAANVAGDVASAGRTDSPVVAAVGRPVTRLAGVQPNPFYGSTEIAFELATPSRARVTVYAPSGRTVRILEGGLQAAGRHTVTWDGRDNSGRRVAPGVYLLRFDAAGMTATSKAIVMP